MEIATILHSGSPPRVTYRWMYTSNFTYGYDEYKGWDFIKKKKPHNIPAVYKYA